ncbi:arginine--tRNA ligase [Accumulibacter sp.]|uniref:arginine--tRNA ligase n=1 Tax=Accumulibacter sp. TaxID=2053492 RepID=UPI0025D0F833|nr:arginine--tRNA ligase [Accumulibacter sp.]MCM8595203.1 arginine--tRNA ligase [Accumulibacter sp.]MCM8625183.1 arginine--tRNA ligase [Accumulibacter sp.]MDS4049349.1 arginine--tRNA ligase [Accumulibacter sp.]
MSSDPKSHIADLMRSALLSVAPDQAATPIHIERPRQTEHGDFACNLAMQLARSTRRSPRQLAQLLVSELPYSSLIESSEVAGAGFINFRLSAEAKLSGLLDVFEQGADYGRSLSGGRRKVLVEFVSANPTGPLHVGHGRGAAYGDSLCKLLDFAGWNVTSEYYVNDAGRQMDILAISTWLRYLELSRRQGPLIDFPPNAYQGDYVREMATQMLAAHGDRYRRPFAGIIADLPRLPDSTRTDAEATRQREEYLDALIANGKQLLGEDWKYVHDFVLTEQLADCRKDLEESGVHFDVWFSEESLFETGLVARCIERLDEAGHLYVQDGARWFRSTAFGDEKDRVVQRDNGLYTYFASDIAYHLNKYERGFDRLINVWGADHHGYIPRVRGAIRALGLDPDTLEVALVQFAVLYRSGWKAQMSTRSGDFVTLRTLREDVGNDACRFFYVLRKSDQHLDFDLDLARSQSNDNPVYYIQYAHARVCSVLAQWAGDDVSTLAAAKLGRLDGPLELALANRIGEFPEVVETAASDRAPHQIAFYLKDLAGEFHSYYNAERILVDDPELRDARLALVASVRQVIRNGMKILGVSCPESM